MEIINVTLNPNDMGAGHALSNGNLRDIITNYTVIRATHGKTSGKWYWEVKFDSGNNLLFIGISNRNIGVNAVNISDPHWRAFRTDASLKYPESSAYGSVWVAGNIIGVALDLDNGTLEFYKNGVSMGISHTNVKELGEVFPTIYGGNTTSKTITINFGATPFVYNIPNGFKEYAMYPSHKILISSEDKIYSVNPEVIGAETVIPQMTSNTAPSGRAFAKDIYSDNVSYDAWKAFDRTDSGGYLGKGSIGYLGYEFEKPTVIHKYTVRSASFTRNSTPKDWTFEGSNDGTDWTILDTQVGQASSPLAYIDLGEYIIEINKIGSYKMYRLNWTTNNGFIDYTSIGELRLYTPPKLLVLPNQLEQTFINHGMNKDTSVDLTTSKILERRYIVQDNAELGSGRVFKQKIDTTKIPIKNTTIE